MHGRHYRLHVESFENKQCPAPTSPTSQRAFSHDIPTYIRHSRRRRCCCCCCCCCRTGSVCLELQLCPSAFLALACQSARLVFYSPCDGDGLDHGTPQTLAADPLTLVSFPRAACVAWAPVGRSSWGPTTVRFRGTKRARPFSPRPSPWPRIAHHPPSPPAAGTLHPPGPRIPPVFRRHPSEPLPC